MKSTTNNRISLYIGAAMLATLMLAAFVPTASAQITYTNYTPNTQDEMIAYLNGFIAGMLSHLGGGQQLQVQNQLQLQDRVRGRVRGVSYSPVNTRVEVGTAFLRSTDDEITFNGIIDLNDASYAYVWFEYGQDEDFDDRTDRERVTRDGRFSIDIDKDEFDENEWYDYRAVAEDPSGRRDYGTIRSLFVSDRDALDDDDDDDRDEEPDVETGRAEDVDEDSAELTGEVDMNDFRNGVVFFVYGEDEDQIEDVEDDFDSYRDVDEDGDDLQKELVDNDLDGREDYTERITGLDEDTDYYYQICVEYEDEDDDEVLECGGVEDFTTDED